MNPFVMAARLLGDTRLTPGQLAQLRAVNTKYHSELAARERSPAASGHGTTDIQWRIVADIREMLTDEQRVVFDRNLPGVMSAGLEPDG